MLYTYYNAIKTKLATVSELDKISWFNNNYEQGIIGNGPVAFIEFIEPLEIDYQSKQSQSAGLTFRLHVASKIINFTGNIVPDTEIAAHEAIVQSCKDLLQGFEAYSGVTQLTKHMRAVAWQHNHYINGWAVTQVDFEAKAVNL